MIEPKQIQYNDPMLSTKKLRSLNFFGIGFLLYSLGNTFSATTIFDIKISQAIQIPGLLIMFTTFFGLIQFKFDNKYLKLIFTLYILWFITLIFRGLNHLANYTFLKSFLFNPSVGMLYFAPLVLLFPKNLKVLKKMFDLIIIFGISYIAIDLLAVRDLLNPVRSSLESVEVVETFANLSLASGFMLLTYGYHSKKRQLFSLGIMVICLLLAIIRARRGLILMNGEILFFSYVLHLIDSKLKLLIIYISILLGLLAMIYINGIYKPEDSRLFGFIVDRGTEDTRSGVELYFYNDMKTNDWIRGKGIDGEYFCPNIEEDQKTNYRSVIETGYLQTILKGGIISLGLFLIIAIPAIIRGIFYSKNMLSKAAGIWILMSLINMYPATVNAFTFPYLLVWISIGICYSKKLRDLPEDFLKKYFRGIT